MPKKRKNPFRTLIWLVILIALVAGGAKIYYEYLKSPVNGGGATKAFVVQKGESVASVAQRLQDEGVIHSELIFRFLLKQKGGLTVGAGDFKLSSAMSTEEVIQVLSLGPADKWVTLIEGWRDEEVAERLNKELGIDKSEFLKKAEQGYMFPDTYLFNKDATVDTVVSTLRNTFDERYSDELQSKIRKLGLTPEGGVILASIVEREARSDEVRTKVASIYLKRLKIGMGLDADATVQYALGYQSGEKGWWKKGLTLNDLKFKSPYNTYLNAGLPPTPICNPSLSSLKAVANGDPSTPYLYYFHDSAGNSYYGKTLEEHNLNVANHR